jgi:hypothetical protein
MKTKKSTIMIKNGKKLTYDPSEIIWKWNVYPIAGEVKVTDSKWFDNEKEALEYINA